ncbi:siderophore ABC transporter substrate-binding protein [Clostridium paraputrificum]|uniref:siderophore ABC transporter substrate-binding protein n=1 Tax=Clostridium TaxID=1485 RepID=UPI0018AA6BE4|nr:MULTISPECIES: siderophore ABC transporter substrate-binding protein [Clostridium]MDB2074705.1 siderophore ABC transporter substrate-binding protein [Clostridium paraputrificum]MDB2079362.1 siderophore ABC transporter substrate-binding protein [Clostridium paraputrificum]MDB2085336.1 siderophore ABC transporter substrate-binding protein [Clostridium paraputrificum]MDB2099913.1 siderophore ABC transporter substrate-binding protein [Clostridium paraputrificum]MDU1031421.1 siderophore ABC trans
MSKKTIISMIVIIAVIFGIYGVTKFAGNGVSADGEKIKITHKLGETEVTKNPSRVIVFDYGIADALNTLDVEIIGLPKSSLPSLLSKYEDGKYENVGSLKEPDMEKVYELKPDLIIMSGRLESYYEELNKIAPTIYLGVDNTDYLGSFKKNMETLGQIFDKEKDVKAQVAKVEEAISKVNEKAEGVNALIALANDNAFSVYGEGSRFGIIHKEFGIEAVDKTIESSTHGQKASFEYILDKNPDYLFVIDRAAVTGGNTSAKEMFDNEIIKKTDAYKNGNIVYLDADVWYTISGGIESTQKMVEEVLEALK